MTSRTCLPLALAALTSIVFPAVSWAENEIGYIEKFALAADREKVLGELVPGSEDYYFFHALHYQNTRNAAKLAGILEQWKTRFPDESQKRRVIENRAALLDYDASPQKTLAYLKERLGVQFNHQQEVRDRKPNLPSTLDPKRIARDVFEKNALANNGDLSVFSAEALESLVANKVTLTVQQRRAVLEKLQRPDVANLPALIIADLKSEESPAFGEFPIHRALLPAQLDALAKAIPDLATTEPFVFTKLRKLAPGADADVEFDPVEREAWLDRLWAYAKTLPPAFNTVKAHILYRRLDHERKKPTFSGGFLLKDRALFLEYLKLPREADYVNPKWLEKRLNNENAVDLGADLDEALPGARPIENDEALVRDYFLHLFEADANSRDSAIPRFEDFSEFTNYVRSSWLKPIFAEAMITFGFGTAEKWASLLTPQEFQALKERVDIEFPRSSPALFQPADEVKVDVVLKNTPKLIVKIYELNALNFFLANKRQLNTDLSLDGLVANSEQTHTIDDGPFKRRRHTFKFPELKGKRGAWIVEFIGGGRSSRALVRKGQWQLLQQTGPGGDLLTVLDEQGAQVKDAVVWLDGRKLSLDEKLGRIVVPFTKEPGERPIVIANADGSFATLTQFEHHAEEYLLDAQFHIEREQLLARREATVAVRVALMLGEAHLDPRLLTEPKLTITSVSLDGISTTREVKDLKLSAGSVLTHTLSVPERVAQLSVTLSAKVDVLTAGGEKRTLNASHSWSLNGIDKTDATNDGHLSKFGGDYVYELLGRNGEPVADQQIVFTFTHRDFTRTETVALRTDEKGRVALGALAGIRSFAAKAPNGREGRFELNDFDRTWASEIHAKAGDAVRVPATAAMLAPRAAAPVNSLRQELSLLQVSGETFTADESAKVKLDGGFLVIEGLAAGDYSLRLRGDARDIAIKVASAKSAHGWILGANRNLEAMHSAPLQIASAVNDKEFITVKLANATPLTRVHIAATRFVSARNLFAGFGGFERFGVAEGKPARQPNLYAAGRQIGDEYRYILERRYAKMFPGNMLTRPGLLLNPWDIRDTGVQDLAQKLGEEAAATGGDAQAKFKRQAPEPAAPGAHDPEGLARGAAESDLDFLAASAPAIYNLIPDENGIVKIDRKVLGDRQHVQIYAEDLHEAVWRSFALPEVPTKFADLRLARNLDPAKPFTQKKEVTVLEAGRTLTLADILTSELETYDTLGGIHALFTTLSHDANLAQFAWVLQWPKLKDDEKRAKYSEFACHELHLFLARKDPAFFEKVIKPYLANKKDRTFMDDFLLGNDVKPYLEPWAFEKLNAAERALLGQRLPDEATNLSRNLREKWELLPPNPERLDVLFETGLRGRALEQADAGNALGLELREERAKAEHAAKPSSNLAPAKPMGAADAPHPVPTIDPSSPVISFNGKAYATNGTGLSVTAGTLELGRAAGEKKAHGLAFSAAEMEGLADAKKELAEDMPALRGALKQADARRKVLDESGLVEKEGEDKSHQWGYFAGDVAGENRAQVRAYYRLLGATKEWAENNYYRLRIQDQNATLVPVNAFWRDYAAHVASGAKTPFVSPHVAEASRNFSEMMLALAVLDLPFDAPKHTSKADAGQLTLTAGGPLIVFHKEIKPAAAAKAGQGELLVSQTFFRHGDRYRMVSNEKFEKYVTDEFLTGTVYGANAVVTNPTSAPVKAEVLLQIPQGAVPVAGSKATDSRYVRLEPYTTKTFEYYFYFPAVSAQAGAKFPHFPVNVAVANTSAAAAKAFEFNVVGKLTQVDKASWDYISQYGSADDVFAFLGQNNLAALNLARIAWRCHDAAFFKKLTGFLGEHHIWNETIYSYALVHNDAAALREWLKHKDQFVRQCGPWLSSKLILLDPIERRSYEHLEYSPLVNQRAHRIGSDWRIANPAVLGQYRGLLNVLAHKPQLDAMDTMSVAYYLFLQDRVDEALTRFHTVDPSAMLKQIQHDNFGPGGAGFIAIETKAVPTRIQYDYFRCYADFYEGNLADARGIASQYADFPVARWQKLFGEVTTQLDEIEGKAMKSEKGDKPDREKEQSALAATEPAFDFKVENKAIALTWKNLGDVTINYYLMDAEFSFSSNPFVSQNASRFSIVKPSMSARQELPKGKDALEVALPGEFAKANVLVEIVGAGQRKAHAYHANTLKLTVAENYGRLEALDSGTGKAVSKAYVKVYARLKNGTVRFFKDGYTDLRGRFDYASLNGSPNMHQSHQGTEPAPANGLDYQMLKPAELNDVEKLAVLILSDTNGAVTREINPPRN